MKAINYDSGRTMELNRPERIYSAVGSTTYVPEPITPRPSKGMLATPPAPAPPAAPPPVAAPPPPPKAIVEQALIFPISEPVPIVPRAEAATLYVPAENPGNGCNGCGNVVTPTPITPPVATTTPPVATTTQPQAVDTSIPATPAPKQDIPWGFIGLILMLLMGGE